MLQRERSLSREKLAQLNEMQRVRILSAAILAIHEQGYNKVSVGEITSRARVSRRTFYELFENCDACLLAVFENTLELIEHELAVAGLDELSWRARMRVGLFAILAFLQRDTMLARVCIVESGRGGAAVFERRAAILARLATVVDCGRQEGEQAAKRTLLTAEGVVGAAFTILHARLYRDERAQLTALHGELLGIVLLPYLGAAAVRREQAQPLPLALAVVEEEVSSSEDPLRGLRMRLTYRTIRVLESVAAQPGASNRQVGARADVGDQGQISKLLGRLQGLGLVHNTAPHMRGAPNAWMLTPRGEQVERSIRPSARPRLVRGSARR
jgi:AcrR family transcriptional regulator